MAKKIKVQPTSLLQVVVTREARATQSILYIERSAQGDVEQADEELAKFSRKLADDAVNAFEWSADAFSKAAKKRAAQEVLYVVEQGKERTQDEYTSAFSPEHILKSLKHHLFEAVLRSARWPERSTSVPSNFMSQELAAARADWLEKVNRMVERLGEEE